MLYELTISGQLLGQQYINRWSYSSTGVGSGISGSQALLYAFGAFPQPVTGLLPADGILAVLLGGLSSSLSISNATAAALYDPEDFYEVPYPTPMAGSQATDCPSPALSYAIRSSRVRTDIDRGRKLFGGVNESHIMPGGFLDSTIIAQLTEVTDRMSAPLEYDDEGSLFTFVSCVISKEEYTTPRGKKAYKKYATLAEQMEHVALGVSWQVVSTVRTTRSRQYGHGA